MRLPNYSVSLSLSLCLVLPIVVRWYHDRSFYGSHVRICTTNRTTEYMSSEIFQNNICSVAECFVAKTRVSFCRNYYYNVLNSVLNAGAKRSGATCHMAIPQCCYLAKGAKRPSHTTILLTSSIDQLPYILAATALKANNLNSAV